eukprot:1449402-Rhodomonas_salina.1
MQKLCPFGAKEASIAAKELVTCGLPACLPALPPSLSCLLSPTPLLAISSDNLRSNGRESIKGR